MEKKVSGKHSSMNGFAMMKGRVATVVLASALLLGGGLTAQAQNAALTTCSQSAATAISQNPNWKANAAEWQKLKGEITLYMTNDMGRNGYYDQKPIAELMGEMADTVDPECVLAVGDIHHFNGVTSTQDPLWLTNYEYVYSHPDLMLDWFPVCGNHEYRGNTQAFMEYGKVSRRWMMPAKYYTKVFDHKGTTVRVIFLDTTPLIDSYRKNSEIYPDACKQEAEAQLSWLDETLKLSLIHIFGWIVGGIVPAGYQQQNQHGEYGSDARKPDSLDRKSTRLNSSHLKLYRMPSSA